MQTYTSSLIDSGSVGSSVACIIIADMLYDEEVTDNGQIHATLTLQHKCESEDISLDFYAVRSGINVFCEVLDFGSVSFATLTIDSMKVVQLIEVHVTVCGEVAA